MLYNNIKLYRPVTELIIPPSGYDDKNICFYFISENDNFLNVYNNLNIPPKYIKRVFVPYTRLPIGSKLDTDYRKKVMEYNLKPITAAIGHDFSDLFGHNFFFDTSVMLAKAANMWNMVRYNSGHGYKVINTVSRWAGGIPKDYFHRILLYAINIDNPIPDRITNRRIYPIYDNIRLYLQGKADAIFDQVLVFYYDYSGGQYIKVFDVESRRNQQAKIKNIINTIQNNDKKGTDVATNIINTVEAPEKSNMTNNMSSDDIQKVTLTLNSYSKNINKPILSKDPDEIITKSVLYHTIGDKYKAEKVTKLSMQKGKDFQTKLTTDKLKTVLPKVDVNTRSTNPFVSNVNVGSLVDNENPKHLLDFRERDFNENLQTDVVSAFKSLENEKIPLKLVGINVVVKVDGPDEISKTVIQIFKLKLKDSEGNIHNVEVEFPYMGKNGTFTINGQEKALVAQLVTYPIFFFKQYEGMFQSSYAKFTIFSRKLKKGSYLQLFMANYKLPLFAFLGYKLGFNEALKLFGITNYEIVQEKPVGFNIKIPDGKYLIFKQELNDVQTEYVESMVKSLQGIKSINYDIDTIDYWKEVIIKNIGNRSAVYYIDKAWDNIVTPIEVSLLSSRGDPTELKNIIKYIAENVTHGRIDDRNDLHRLRIRMSELFTSQLQKQIKSAYSEWESKKMGGDENAEYRIIPRKVRSEIVQSPNINMFESINPLEELSMLTRITPVGIGGIPDAVSFPQDARNIHQSYYGTIDPLETPDSDKIGIQQHLSIGASLTNSRGMFSIVDKNNVNPSAILSAASSVVPFINHDEGARVTMAVGQSKQAFPLKYSEPPAVQTGHDSILTSMLSDNFVVKSPFNGVIEDVDNNTISVRSNDNKLIVLPITPKILRSGQGKNGLSIFRPIVKVGDKVKASEIVAEGSNIREGTIANGVNLLCAFMPWKGYNFEDGMVLSEEATKKFVSLHLEEIQVNLEDDDDVAQMVKVGDVVKKGDILISYSSTIHDVESYSNLRAEAGGRIVSIEIYNNRESHEGTSENRYEVIPDKIRPQYDSFVSYYRRVNGEYPAGRFKDNGSHVNGILIKFIIVQELMLTKGDKVNNRHYNKGVISIIEPEEYMPLTPWGERVEIIYNPISVINRMNPGQLLEMHTAMVSRFLALKMEKLDRQKFIELFQKVLLLLDMSNGQTYTKSLISKLKSINDKKYEELRQKAIKDRFIPIIIPPFKSPPATNVVKALNVVGAQTTYPLEIKLKDGRIIHTKPVSLGYLYVVKLEHISEKKIHSRGIGPYISQTFTPTEGKKRSGGAKIGEYEFYSLLAYDAETVIDEMFGSLSADHQTKNEMFAEIIRTGDTNFKHAKTNPVHDLFVQMMRSIHLVSE